MSNHSQNQQQLLEVKSKYDAEFRRFGLDRLKISKFEEFYYLVEKLHGLYGIQFNICYTDKDGDLLPINNDNNLARVLQVTMGILRLIILRKGECYPENANFYFNGNFMQPSNLNFASSNLSYRPTNFLNQIKELSTTLTSHNQSNSVKPFVISYPEDFRPVSAIIDVDILPDTFRRVRLHKHKSSKPLGFYIRDGRSLRVTPHGVEQVPGIFISRLVPGGLAESTGLLSVNDEVIEVNGIEVSGKTLDQVTDMMVANSSNLIITVKPTNQKYNLNRTQYNNSIKSTSKTSYLNKNMQMSKKNDLFSKNCSYSASSSSINSSSPSINKILNAQKDLSFKAGPNNSTSNWQLDESHIN
ncbi:partitioning defective 6 [Brachionus plicatilis]|uniref:Partitioning defective 6 n=1 Tax=Brachionus plicatilis TaxID=10195 RepID=A0A3M7SLM0_BRAPC|nr:partitioning defective 6 [Brachionus plicatilis]